MNKSITFGVLLLILLSYGCAKDPVCGNGKIEEGETYKNCCSDFGCLGDQTCQDNKCLEPRCKECEYLSEYRCIKFQCCNSQDCSKHQICKNNTCINVFISPCEECEIEVKKDVAIISYLGTDPDELVSKFIRDYGDNYDFITIYVDFDRNREPSYHSDPLLFRGQKLKGINVMGNINGFFNPLLEGLRPPTALGVLHETGHTWCCYNSFMDWAGNESKAWLQGNIHWHDKLLDVGTYDPMGGAYKWIDNGDGTLTSVHRSVENGYTYEYSNLTLYLMGLLEKDQVSPVKFAVTEHDTSTLIIKGKMHEISIEDIILNNRSLTLKQDARSPHMAFILWTKDYANDEEIFKVVRMKNLFEKEWYVATKELSNMSTKLT